MDTFIVRSLEHAKLLTDPFKLQLLEQFSGSPVTTKQVADKMGEKAPRLYRHVDALFDAGFLELVEEKPKRGTIERYFRTVAERFEVDRALFSPSAGQAGEGLDMMRGLLREAETDLDALCAQSGTSPADGTGEALLMKVAVRGTEEEIAGLRQKLNDWLEECASIAGQSDTEDSVAYSGLLAFYPKVAQDGE